MSRLTAHPEPIDTVPTCPQWLVRDLRSDHAGETGAVYIYRGILAASRDPAVRDFARRHLATEQAHLELIDAALAHSPRSRLGPLWQLAGWLLGALPALFGSRAVYTTIDAVESFVDGHYGDQIDALRASGEYAELRATLERCRADELEHRDEARALAGRRGWLARLWRRTIDTGSRLGVAVARRV